VESSVSAGVEHAEAANTRQKLQFLLHYLGQTHVGLVRAVDGLSEQQWQFSPAPGCWSIAQVVEHIVAAEEAILRRIAPGRLPLAAAPASMVPAGRWGQDEALCRFFAVRQRIIECLRSRIADHQWALFVATHSERHTRQILGIKADRGFSAR
jgi:hypothetical protein